MDKALTTKNILVTGGCGFIGSNLVHRLVRRYPKYLIVNLDKLTYAGNPDNVRDLEAQENYVFVRGDIADASLVTRIFQQYRIDAVIHLAAESHVDRSILDAGDFIQTNVFGTFTLLEAAREDWQGIPAGPFLHVSTDEVYGSLGSTGEFKESDALRPRSPYSASKAAGELLARSYHETFRLPVVVVRPSNTYGPFQLPEKFLPVMITNLCEDKSVPLYGRGENVRDWLFIDDLCEALDLVFHKAEAGETLNIGGRSERRNIDVARKVLHLMEKGDDCIQFVADRPGHDFRYALDNSKIGEKLGLRPATPFESGLQRTIAWYREHLEWWKPLKARLVRESKGFWTGGR